MEDYSEYIINDVIEKLDSRINKIDIDISNSKNDSEIKILNNFKNFSYELIEALSQINYESENEQDDDPDESEKEQDEFEESEVEDESDYE